MSNSGFVPVSDSKEGLEVKELDKLEGLDTKDETDTQDQTGTGEEQPTTQITPEETKQVTEPVVPETLFAKQTVEDSSRVKIIKAQVDRFVNDANSKQQDGERLRLAVRGFHTAIRTLTTAAATEVPVLIDYILDAIRRDKGDSFRLHVYKFNDKITSSMEHDCYMRLINLFKIAAKNTNPTLVHEEVDVMFSIALISNAEAYKAFLNYFQAK